MGHSYFLVLVDLSVDISCVCHTAVWSQHGYGYVWENLSSALISLNALMRYWSVCSVINIMMVKVYKYRSAIDMHHSHPEIKAQLWYVYLALFTLGLSDLQLLLQKLHSFGQLLVPEAQAVHLLLGFTQTLFSLLHLVLQPKKNKTTWLQYAQ